MAKEKGVRQIAQNRKAFHDYFVLDRFEAGIELFGTEVKSIRGGKVNLKDSFCFVKNGELFLRGMHISPYEHGNIFNRDPVRVRRLRGPHPTVAVFQGEPREGGAGPVQGQEAL